jgi:hypothetical protein
MCKRQLIQRFKVKFTFEHESLLLDADLQAMRTKIFMEEGTMEVVPVCSVHRASMIIHELLECYNVAKEYQDEENPLNIQIPKTEGECVVEGPKLEYTAYAQPLKTHKVNIGTQENPKFVEIGDYWNDETVEKIVDLLHEYQNLFPNTLSDMKGIVGELGELKIPLKPGAKLVRQRCYQLNMKYKEKVKAEID